MSINSPLIKAQERGLIISSTTANVYELLKKREEKRGERPNMKNTKDLLKAYTDATIFSGAESSLGDKLGAQAAKALTDALDKSARATYNATQNLFARTSATANITNEGPKPPKADDNTPSSTPRMSR
jgi:hypothetical protein